MVIAIIAFLGVVGAAVYALRMFITAMHNRVGPRVASHEIGWTDAAALVPIVLVILVLAFYPQFVLKRSEATVKTVSPVAPLVASR
jgi:NADH:ubiquinone oxidoreductase subunit 4 (subunit M)